MCVLSKHKEKKKKKEKKDKDWFKNPQLPLNLTLL